MVSIGYKTVNGENWLRIKISYFGWSDLELEAVLSIDPSWTADDEVWLSVGHESKCISMAISRFPFVASNNDVALSLLAPVTFTNSAIKFDHFSAILNTNWPRKNRGKKTAGGLGLACPREFKFSNFKNFNYFFISS